MELDLDYDESIFYNLSKISKKMIDETMQDIASGLKPQYK